MARRRQGAHDRCRPARRALRGALRAGCWPTTSRATRCGRSTSRPRAGGTASAYPRARRAAMVFLFSEGVLMHLEPAQVEAAFATFGERAPARVRCWPSMPCAGSPPASAHRHPSVRLTGAQFRWGLRRPAELARAHPRRLRLAGTARGDGRLWLSARHAVARDRRLLRRADVRRVCAARGRPNPARYTNAQSRRISPWPCPMAPVARNEPTRRGAIAAASSRPPSRPPNSAPPAQGRRLRRRSSALH